MLILYLQGEKKKKVMLVGCKVCRGFHMTLQFTHYFIPGDVLHFMVAFEILLYKFLFFLHHVCQVSSLLVNKVSS